MGIGCSSPGGETDHSPLSAEVEDEWSSTSTPPFTTLWHVKGQVYLYYRKIFQTSMCICIPCTMDATHTSSEVVNLLSVPDLVSVTYCLKLHTVNAYTCSE